MATSIEVTRKTPAAKLDHLQTDAFKWKVAERLRTFLHGRPLALVRGKDVESELGRAFADTTGEQDPPHYWWYWQDPPGEWIRVCMATHIVTVPDPDQEKNPVLVRVSERARYA